MSDYDKIKQLILTLEWENVQLAIELDKGLKTGAFEECFNAIPVALTDSSYILSNGDTDYSIRLQLIERICKDEIVYNSLIRMASEEGQIKFCEYFSQSKKIINIGDTWPKMQMDAEYKYKNIHFLPF